MKANDSQSAPSSGKQRVLVNFLQDSSGSMSSKRQATGPSCLWERTWKPSGKAPQWA